MTLSRVCGALVLLGCGAVVSAQTFRSTTTYVRLDVVVTDRSDRPITDLTQEDFRIVERGKAQTIADFAQVSVPVESRSINLDAALPPGADIATNSLVPRDSRAFTIVVDDSALSPGDLVWIKRTLSALIGGFSSDDQVALTYVRRSDLGQDFTNDPTRLIAAVNNAREAFGMPASLRDMLTVLDNVIKTMGSGRQTRRAIILISTRGCNPHGNSIVNTICKAVIERSLEVGVPVYAIDPTGQFAETAAASTDDPLAHLAVGTGGLRYRQAEPWLSPARALADNGHYYLLGYYPNPLRDDGKFQNVEVTVNRPGAVVRARKGYTAPWRRPTVVTPTWAMTASLGEGLPDPSLPIRVFVAPLAAGPRNTTRTSVTVEIAYPVPAGGFNGDLNDQLRIGILALDADAKTKASFQRPITFTGTWKPSAQGTFVVNETIDVPAQPLTFRVAVQSRALGRTGTAHLKVDVPDYRDRELRVSPLVLGLQDEVIDTAIGLDRLRVLLPFQPTTRRAFVVGDVVRLFAMASWRGEVESLDARISIDGASEWPPVEFAVEGTVAAGAGRTVTIDRTVRFQGLAPGAYTFRLTTRLGTDESVTRLVPFVVR